MDQEQLECLKIYFHTALLTLSNHSENKMEANEEHITEKIPISMPKKSSKQMMLLKKKNKSTSSTK